MKSNKQTKLIDAENRSVVTRGREAGVREMSISAMNVKLQVWGNIVNLSRVQYFIALLVLEVRVFLSLQRNKASMLRHVFFVLLI